MRQESHSKRHQIWNGMSRKHRRKGGQHVSARAETAKQNELPHVPARAENVLGEMLCRHQFPWHPSTTVHRFIWLDEDSDAPLSLWRDVLSTFTGSFVHVVWCYVEAHAQALVRGCSGHIIVCNASAVLDMEEFIMRRKLHFPLQWLKDLFQVKCVRQYGGWWVDLDMCCVWSTLPEPLDGHEVMAFRNMNVTRASK